MDVLFKYIGKREFRTANHQLVRALTLCPTPELDLIQSPESSEVENFKSSCAEDHPEGSSEPAFEREG